jgi:hypothetical protein
MIKKLVNDYELYTALQNYIGEEVELSRKSLENHNDPAEMHRLQGEIRVWRRLQKLREKING